MKDNKSNKEKIHDLAHKMGLKFIENKNVSEPNFRIINVSKPGRPEVKKSIQRQLEATSGLVRKV